MFFGTYNLPVVAAARNFRNVEEGRSLRIFMDALRVTPEASWGCERPCETRASY
jgi:hypothetical protein